MLLLMKVSFVNPTLLNWQMQNVKDLVALNVLARYFIMVFLSNIWPNFQVFVNETYDQEDMSAGVQFYANFANFPGVTSECRYFRMNENQLNCNS